MNRDTINKMSLIDLLSKISKGIDECLYQVLSGCKDVEKRSRCEKMHSCYDCLSAWLNEGGKLMFIDGKWYTEPEIKAHIMELQKKLSENTYSQELEAQLELMKKFLECVRAYFRESIGWVDLFEKDFQKLLKGQVVDVQPFRHGHWIISSDGYYPYCSECKNEPENGKMTEYCSKCGARMDGDTA